MTPPDSATRCCDRLRAASDGRRPASRRLCRGQPLDAPKLAAGLHLVATPIGNLRRYHAARAGDPGCRRSHSLRGYPHQPQAARSLRHRHGADPLSRSQRRSRAAETHGAAGRRRGGCADVGCRHAADLRSWLQARARGARGGLRRARRSRRLGGIGRARRIRPADRPLLLRGLPAAKGQAQRRARIAELARIPATSGAVRERPAAGRQRLPISPPGSGSREAAVCRELTKLHEEVRRGTLAALAAHYAGDAETRGEIVIVIAPPGEEAQRAGLDAMIRARAGPHLGQGRGR